MMNCLIFTKDRGCQLELLTESIQKYFLSELDIHILVKASTNKFGDGYDYYLEKHPHTNFHWQHSGYFKDQVMAIINNFDYKWTVCFLDDDVFISPTNLDPVLKYITDGINAFSLRMGDHINYCYPKDCKMDLPEFTNPVEPLIGERDNLDSLMRWRWLNYQRDLDWGYPMSLGGNIYRTEWLRGLWAGLPFSSPNYIEGYMAMNAPHNKPYQISFTKQRLYNVANNLVQNVCENRYDSNPANYVETLNDLYLEGKHLDLDKIAHKIYRSANGPATYKMIRRE